MDDLIDTEEKFKRILIGFSNEKYKVVNDVYFEMLMSHLSGKTGKDYSVLLQLPFILEWIEQCLEILQNDFNKLNPHVVSFMLKLCTLMANNEWIIIKLRERRFADKIENVLQKNKSILSPGIKLGHIGFLSAISTKSLGLGWIKDCKAWSLAIEYCQQNQTIYVFRESKEFLSEILYKFSVFGEKTHNEELVIEILTEIIKPIIDSVYEDNKESKVKVDDFELQRKLEPTLCLLCHILTKTLEKDSKTKIVHYLEQFFNFEKNIWKLAYMTQNEQFLSKIFYVLTSYNYAKLLYEKCNMNGKIASEDFNQFGVNFFNFFKFCLTRKTFHMVLKLLELNHILWKKLGNKVPEEIVIENERIKFENQIIVLHLVPVLFKLNKLDGYQKEFMDTYIMKLFTISCGFTQRLCYAFRDVLFEYPEVASDLANKSIHAIISMENVLDQDRAVLVFQALIYCLKEYTPGTTCTENDSDTGTNNKDPDTLMEIPNVLFAALLGLQTLIQKYRITWKESIESTCLLNLMLFMLNNPNLTSRLAVQAIKLTQLSIEHFLSPNLALLIENLSGSAGMQNLSPMIVKRLHDNSWEVRDSTLELVTSIANISQLKFPVFKQNLLDHGICPIVFSMAKNDSESYVRASALKCLCQMIVINLLWEECLCSLDIVDHLLSTLFVESEGIVRKEAVMLLTKIYNHRKIPIEKMKCVFSTLTYCAVSDLHWEVKINALYFWKVFISHQFTNQGMIDGTFPTVTFSKEKKKIVTLTEKEILLRIHKIMSDLSDHGCLGIILECLNDDCDLEVVKVAVIIVKKLLEHLKKYDYSKWMEDDNKNQFNNQNNLLINNDQNYRNDTVKISSSSSLSSSSSSSSTSTTTSLKNNEEIFNSDNVIESIISSNDINLLSMAYKNQMQFDSCNSDFCKVDENLYKKYSNIKAKDFLNEINAIDLDHIIKKRSDWIMSTESLDSLLDDMLFSIKTLEVNDADCY